MRAAAALGLIVLKTSAPSVCGWVCPSDFHELA
jgi:hypothetical protein